MFRCFSTLRNIFDTIKRVFYILGLLLKALQPFTRGFPSVAQRDIYYYIQYYTYTVALHCTIVLVQTVRVVHRGLDQHSAPGK